MNLRHPLRLLLAGLALGWLFDVLFYGKLPGISLLLFAGLALAALLLALRWEAAAALRGNWWLAGGLLVLAVLAFVRASGFLIFLDVAASLVLLALLAVHLTQRPVAAITMPELLAAPFQALAMALVNGGRVAQQAGRQDLQRLRGPGRQHALPVLRGLLLAAPLLLIFTALLASADLIFADLIERFLNLDFLAHLGEWLWRGLLIMVVGFVVMGGLAYAVRRPGAAEAANDDASGTMSAMLRFLGLTESAVVINAVNGLFLLFGVIQIPYLFGGRLNIAAEGFTYAEYARRGFAELVVVAVMVLGLILALNAVTRRIGPRQTLIFDASSTLLIALTMILLASAFKRLLLYEEAYGFTRLRIYPHVFMIWLALLLGWFMATLWRRPDRFAVGLLAAALGFVVTLGLLNPDAFIVRQNFRRSQALPVEASPGRNVSQEIDVYYLTMLSEDAVAALLEVARHSSGAMQEEIDRYLLARGQAMQSDQAWRHWPSFHMARYRAYQLLLQRYGEDTLKGITPSQ